jgi:hypothetical protein
MALLRGVFWFVLFMVLTFCFVVLFEYGPADFANGARKEYARVKFFLEKQTEKIGKPKKNR